MDDQADIPCESFRSRTEATEKGRTLHHRPKLVILLQIKAVEGSSSSVGRSAEELFSAALRARVETTGPVPTAAPKAIKLKRQSVMSGRYIKANKSLAMARCCAEGKLWLLHVQDRLFEKTLQGWPMVL